MILLQIALATAYMVLIPYLTGCLIMPWDKNRGENAAWTLAAGLVTGYALYEILALFFIRLSGSFRLLSVLFGVLSVCLAAAGALLRSRRNLCAESKDTPRRKVLPRCDPFFLAGVLLIVIQIGAILFLATPDKDDAFYSGLSSICFSQDSVLQTDAYDGLLQRGIGKRYVLSALPAYQATLSLLSDGLHHLFITHNLFPLFYMPLAYALLYNIGKRFLRSEGIEKAEGKLLFGLALLHMIGNYFVFSPENFLVTRMWQGKALFVALGIPCLWHFGSQAVEASIEPEQNGKKQVTRWLIVLFTLLAVSFMGETGLYLGPFLLMCLCLTYLLVCHTVRQFVPAVLCCLPEAVLVLVFLL